MVKHSRAMFSRKYRLLYFLLWGSNWIKYRNIIYSPWTIGQPWGPRWNLYQWLSARLQDPISNALELLQFCTEPSISWCRFTFYSVIDSKYISFLVPEMSYYFNRKDRCLLTHCGRDKMAAIFHTTFSNGFSWLKMYWFQFKFHWSLFLWVQLTIFQHWFRQWLGADQATNHYLNQWWSRSLTHICVTLPQ